MISSETSNNLTYNNITLANNGVELSINTGVFAEGGWGNDCYSKQQFEFRDLRNSWSRLISKDFLTFYAKPRDIIYMKDFDVDKYSIQGYLSSFNSLSDKNPDNYVGCGTLDNPFFTDYSSKFEVSNPYFQDYFVLISVNIDGEENLTTKTLKELDFIVSSIECQVPDNLDKV